MDHQDWFVGETGEPECWPGAEAQTFPDVPYRLYRFLTDLEDLLMAVAADRDRLQAMCPLVRRLLYSSSWLQLNPLPPEPTLGWAVQMLYDEPFFPLTVQLVSWAPGVKSPIHNHACWGLVALIDGSEKNTFWRRSPTPEAPDRIEQVGELILTSGDIITFPPETIHRVEALDNRPTTSFNLYGETDYDRRFEFDPVTHTAKNF